MKRILIINPHGIGDVLFTTPMIANLRLAYPNAYIAYIGNRRTFDFLTRNPKLDRVYAYERDEFILVYKKNPLMFYKKWIEFVQTIKNEHFDIVFDFSMTSTFGFVSWLAGIPRRVGYDYKGRGRFLTTKLPLKGYEGQHVAEYYMDLLRYVGVSPKPFAMEFPLLSVDEQWATNWLKGQGIDSSKKLIAVIPGGGASWGASARNKRWPAGKYAALVDKIIADSGATVILMGDPKEVELCLEVARLAGRKVYSAAGQTSLMHMAALLRACSLAIVNDGGPLHISVAAGVRTVSIFGPVDDRVYGPYPVANHIVVKKQLACQPCYRCFRMSACTHLSCLMDLSVMDVYRKVEPVL